MVTKLAPTTRTLSEVLEIREQHPKDEVAKLWLDSLVVMEGEEKSK
jgi:hypothetical protein